MFRERPIQEINTSHCVSDQAKMKKSDSLNNCNADMVLTAKVEQRCALVGEVR